MRKTLLLITISLLVLSGLSCSEGLPTAPLPQDPVPVPTVGGIYGWVYEADKDRVCVIPAQIEIIAGPTAGVVVQQTAYGCEEWFGFEIDNLPLGKIVRLRVSAPAYLTEEREVTIKWGDAAKIEFHLKRAD